MQTSMVSAKVSIWLVCSVICSSLVRATQSVCSSQNTATTDGVRNQFQSNGWCSNNCAGHQFAIVQGFMCWCSDSEPSTQTSVGDCSGTCPGYGYEDCGNADKDLFGYIYLGQTPLSSVQSVETSTESSVYVSSSSITSSSSTSIVDTTTISPTLTSTSTTPLTTASTSTTPSTDITSALPTTTSTKLSTSIPTSTTSSTSTTTSTSSSTSTTVSVTSSTSTTTSTTSSTLISTSTSSSSSSTPTTTSSAPISTSTTSSTSTSTSTTSPTSSSAPTSSSNTTPTSTTFTTTSPSTAPSSTTVTYTSTTASPITSTITSVNLQTSLKYSVITVTSVHTMDTNISEITSRYLTMTKVITQIYSSTLGATPTSAVATTSASVGGRITNNNNSNTTNSNTPTNKSTEKKGYWDSPGKIAATFVVVGVVCLVIICILIYLIHHYRTRPARKAQDFENEYQSKFYQSKYPNEVTTTTLHTPSPSSNSTFSTPRLIYTDEKGQIMSESPSPRQSTYSLTAGSPPNDPSTLASPFHDPTLPRRTSTFLHSPIQKQHEKMESNVTLGEDTVLVDQRLDPSKMLNTLANDDATNHSTISLSDNVDYSRRVLRLMNE
ncbi:ADI_G0026670.mRNA.1.CDS.1 [Saccharomyces cerevisiae]|uniref:Wsc4p n=3 Tax=Saccharomyces cerevisiae TaxID=4932 RepID=C8ZA36_YEAS8|nr:Wsc4p [Saccharomyces cerevisiae YJM993]AJP39068.1 Wsc4p [Saccharomyces cerevisiae YJM1078]AJU16264.1 Wsc4p [Saccharomyces cerevisiae YJM1356]AJU17550.1 Wsc4p [Saccharomyces cerevisiae YJM1387]AJU19314.1 Wsc4p [Saccharomyces cerevisiae YJM1415]AJU19572.1 Wsc4p [Saccharomyces cerevisiae YJM1417]AJU20337.1 Wsc4p [Saccharomyces cerevisiae YJM1433]AJU22570.1 Wsc4p [Saccharomyces cerevisiae YJM1477]AJU22831.1 Wsc4p [Saccharomyces cerevisiae YJM1478]AJU23511.1 Wsc4p [Saccharomyces cerevisiae Y